MDGPKELGGLAAVRGRVYAFLSSVYLNIPGLDLVENIRHETFMSFLSGISCDTGLSEQMRVGLDEVQRFAGAVREQPPEAVWQQLAVDRTRLFRGIKPGYSPPAPYESSYRGQEQTVMGEWAVSVLREYARAGVFLPDDRREPPDHIGVELDFMRFLAQREAESWQTGARHEAVGCLEMEQSFLDQHIVPWVPVFCHNVIDMAGLDFYRGVARITTSFVVDDLERVQEILHLLLEGNRNGTGA
ncbi:MAG: molecular chaperone TorD family protein [Desulfobacterales bacterium]|nr:molecular chaperone TorD family protein [Desulfobacterales bacterium]